jgi:hypothetical protein
LIAGGVSTGNEVKLDHADSPSSFPRENPCIVYVRYNGPKAESDHSREAVGDDGSSK